MAFRLVTAAPRLVTPTLYCRAVPVASVASFQAGRSSTIQAIRAFQDGASYVRGSVNEAAVLPPKDKVAGSYHWDFERLLSIGLIPLTAASVVQGAHPITDLFLGVILPIHCHIGFDAIITDYLPARRNPILNRVSSWGLRGATLLVLVGCYQFNTNDVGLTEAVKRVWHA